MTPYDCDTCSRSFKQFQHYQDHLTNSPRHFYCKPCNRLFVGEKARQDHLEQSSNHRRPSNQHSICKCCNNKVDNLNSHNQKHHHECPACKCWFNDLKALEKHQSEDHGEIYCKECSRLFDNPNNLKFHMMSSTHAMKDIKCRHAKCRASFLSMGCLIAHLEAGYCKSGIDIEQIQNYFSDLDKEGLFVNRKLLQPAIKWDVPTADSEKMFKCPLCRKVKKFRYADQLQQHLASPKHKNRGHKPFICPSRKCSQARFNCLSGLLSHRERGNCEKGHNRELTTLCNQLATGTKDMELRLEIEVVRKNLEALMLRLAAE